MGCRRWGLFQMAGGDPPIPEGVWAKVRWTLTYATSWMIPLVAIERFADGHFSAGAALVVLFAVNLFVVSAWDRLATILGRSQVTMFYIGLGLLCSLGLGISIGKLISRSSSIDAPAQTALPTGNGTVGVNMGRIAWSFDDASKGLNYFLGFHRQNQEEVRISGFNAQGRNTTADPITELTGYVRSNVTNEEWPIYVGAQDPSRPDDPFSRNIPTLLKETYGIPGFSEFVITTFNKSMFDGGKDGMTLSKFLRDFSSFTLVLEYDGNTYRRLFTEQDIKKQLELFERQTDPSKNNAPRIVRRPNATPPIEPTFLFPPPPPHKDEKGG